MKYLFKGMKLAAMMLVGCAAVMFGIVGFALGVQALIKFNPYLGWGMLGLVVFMGASFVLAWAEKKDAERKETK